MIKSFENKATEDFFHGKTSSRQVQKIPNTLWKAAWRKLDLLNYAHELKDLRSPPANRLEKLRGTFEGKYSIRINKQYRVVFEFQDGNAYAVEITDYH